MNLVVLKHLVRGEEKLIVHYLQPHPPFVTISWIRDGSPKELVGSKIYELAARSRINREEFRRAYIENLRYVLKYAKKLAETVLTLGYKVVITLRPLGAPRGLCPHQGV